MLFEFGEFVPEILNIIHLSSEFEVFVFAKQFEEFLNLYIELMVEAEKFELNLIEVRTIELKKYLKLLVIEEFDLFEFVILNIELMFENVGPY